MPNARVQSSISGFARRRYDTLEPHVGDYLLVHLVVMGRVEDQHAEFSSVHPKHFDRLRAFGVGHRIVDRVAITELRLDLF